MDAWVLIHIEVQGTPEQDFARRMFVYYYRIFDRYERPLMSVAILGDEQPEWRPDRFEQELWGCTVGMRYPMVKLLDWRAREDGLAASANPFAVVVRAYLAAQVTRGAVDERQQAKIGLIRGLYERGYGREQILELFRLIDWLLALPQDREDHVWHEIVRIEEDRKMPYITSIERIGIREGQRDVLQRLIRARFGQVPETIATQLAEADQETLERFADRLATASSLDDLHDDTHPFS